MELTRSRLCLLVSLLAWASCFQGATSELDAAISQCQELAPSPPLAKFVDELPRLKDIRVWVDQQIIVGAFKIQQKLHRDLPPTTLYAYGTTYESASYPGPTIEVIENVVSHIRWENHITDSQHMLALDKSIMWANPRSGGVPTVTHVHGAEAHSTSDGHPDAWFTAAGDHGNAYTTQNGTYPNAQPPTMLWYHDHTFGISRVNVLAGLAGLYIIRSNEDSPDWMPKEKFEIQLVLQDKQFFYNGSINFPNVGNSPTNHAQWCPEYFGDTILVNGKAWPYLQVKPQMYRFRVLNAANARVFELSMENANLSFVQIGTDQGLLEKPQSLKILTVAPAERVDLIVDFSTVPGSEVFLNNSGQAPYPEGDAAFSPESTRSVMKFIVSNDVNQNASITTQTLSMIPAVLKEPEALINTTNAQWRSYFMFEMDDPNGNPLSSLLSNLTWNDPATETPTKGATEVWEFINLTPDAHPMHIHLIKFHLLNQQEFNLKLWEEGGCDLFNDASRCLVGEPTPGLLNQVGPKDTILAMPNKVTRLVMQWTAQNGGDFPFDPTTGPGYLWHCHILDHEDNDMMRPIKITRQAHLFASLSNLPASPAPGRSRASPIQQLPSPPAILAIAIAHATVAIFTAMT
ncbi:multicopper oxidase LPR1 [Physcomitrium patens]|uniref:Plastocyanin-like domain-containing protein n=1 Tax=Physcomitrium patens TaxID=3218 RepID=A0A2K1KUW1_PHYPA|nr:multicopper oxidase LPR1-like [Physcomitrium patens]PNR57569.1 hypothetical protein PHYPA_004563 [Physcomitrium patens]|eukprot:XP_024370037.1 multicopper oxidase LPR1-like [Physcomitrella patens]